jgi:hypothetical protein
MTATAGAADFHVANTTDGADPGPTGSLRKAITDANANLGPDNIVFDAGVTGSIGLTNGELAITGPTFIYGPGANVLAVNGSNASRIFNINPAGGDHVDIGGLTLTNGHALASGGAIRNEDADLVVNESVISGNTADGDGGGIYDKGNSPSAGYNALIIDSTISGNHAAASGGGLYGYEGFGGVYSSTIVGNYATRGAGISVFKPGTTIQDSTIASNHATVQAGGIRGITSLGTGPHVFSSIVAGNTAPTAPDFELNPAHTAQVQFSLIQNTSGVAVTSTVAGSNIFGVDPQLGPLQMNGGPTPTMKPAGLSAVVDKGNTDVTIDQRGVARPFDVAAVANAAGGNGADIGAVELQSGDGPFTVPPPSATGRRAAALKKCKKKKTAKKRKKCKKKARKLPL